MRFSYHHLILLVTFFIATACQNPISETGYSTTDLNHPEFSYAGASGTTGSVRNLMTVSPTSFNNNGFTATCSVLPALPPGLSIQPSTCVISGTPLNVLPKTTYIVTAQNIAGLTRQNVVLNVVPSKPTISYTTGVGLVNQTFTHAPTLYDNDSPVTGCTVSPDLPEGFSLHPTTCAITGESEEFINSQTHSVTVTNAIGSTTTSMTFMIAAPPILSYSGVSTAGTVANTMNITPSTLDIQGAAVTSCTTSPALPNGLEINNETCVISGTPSVIDSRSYTVTATNPAGSSTASLSLSILPSPPFVGYSGVLGLGFVALPFLASPSLLVDNGALITNCAPVGGLPSGLSVHPNTCVISGTPSGVSSSTPYTIRATNSAGYTDASFSISISPSAPTISYSGVSGSAVYNSSFTMAPSILNLNGAAISSCTISPALPSGLSIHNSTCAISGTPLVARNSQTYSVTVTNVAGSSTVPITLSVSAIAPTLSYGASNGKTGNAQSSRSITPSSLDGGGVAITNCTISPSLPSGLNINSTTCVIEGTPIVESSQTTYTVTITSAAGLTGTATLPITVSAIPPTISYTASTGNAFSSRTITPTINQGGSTINNCSATLPAGLSIDPLTCVISGTPTTAQGATNHAVTITTGAGLSATASVSITIEAVLPVISYASSTGLTGDIYGARTITPSTLQNGGVSASCSISPALPAGLSLNTSTCVVSGSPTEILSPTLFTVTITNSLGINTADFTLSVSPKVPTLTYSNSSGPAWTSLTINPGSFNNNGAELTSCSSSGLPAGLTVDSSCVISGTPTIAGTGSYSITATNSVGSTTATLTITIAAIAPTISYSASTGNAQSYRTMTPTINAGGSSIGNCTATLPSGLSIDPATCVISGTPSTAQSATNYTVTVTNTHGLSGSGTVSIAVSAITPTISYSASTGNIHSSRTITPTVNAGGSTISNCTASLPAGLSIAPTTCIISGTPTASQSATNHTVTITTLAGLSNTGTVSITVSPIAPALSYASSSGTVNSSLTINPSNINNNGAAISSCTTSGLPAGLSINGSCVISGTPTSAGSGSYSVTATNSAGSTAASITITIAAIAPTLSYSGASGTSGQVNTLMSISPTSLTTGGASITNCTGSLPSGLSINATNCLISGTPSSAQGATNHTITITNSSNLSSTANVSIAISAQLPTISFSGPSTGNVGEARTITPTTYNGGTNISNCTVSPALPAGLSINTSTCVISGTPSSPTGPTNHTVTIHNSAGTGNGSVSITVSGYVCSNHGYDGPSTVVNSLSNCWYNCSARGFDGGGTPNNLNSCYYSCSSRDLCGGNIFHPGSPSSCSNKVWAVVNQSCSNVQTCNQVITSYTSSCGTRLGYVIVQGTQLTSTQAGHDLCAAHVGSGFSWLDFHGGGAWNGISGAWVNNDVPTQRGFVWISNQPANCYWGSGKQLTFGCHSGGAGFWQDPDYGTASPYVGDVPCSSYRPLFCRGSGCYTTPVYTTQCTTNNVCNDVYGWTCN